VKGTKIAAIVDCGADVDYVNEAWCRQMGYKITEEGECLMRGYDGKQKRAMILRASIEFRYQGQRIRQRFRVVEETDDDLMVLGLPWLQRLNPDIDWKKRIVTLRKASKDPRRTIETPALEEAKEASKKPSHDKKKPTGFGKRGGYGGDQFKKTKEQAEEEARYQKELTEVRDKLPQELKEYADVFCKKK
jgi:hypothetical protein